MYEELIESSRACASGYNGNCDRCLFCGMSNDKDGDCYQQLHKAAADAIEELSRRIDLAVDLYNRNVEKTAMMYEALIGLSPEPSKEDE